jgi:hypothetical protein
MVAQAQQIRALLECVRPVASLDTARTRAVRQLETMGYRVTPDNAS